MNKIAATALVTAAAIGTLSACNLKTTTAASGPGIRTQNGYAVSGGGIHARRHHESTPRYSAAEQNAISSAQSYLSMGNGFSRAGLIQQLSSKAGDGFRRADAVFAVNHLSVNWDAQAVQSAKSYLSMGSGFSRASLVQQLSSRAGEQFTLAQATYAANHVGLDSAKADSASGSGGSAVARQNAIQSAQSYLSMGSGFSRAGLIQQLTSKSGEGFSQSDAVYAVNHVSVNWNQQAVLSAKSYLQMGSGFSRADLIQQLSSKAGDQFTVAQATYAADHVGL